MLMIALTSFALAQQPDTIDVASLAGSWVVRSKTTENRNCATSGEVGSVTSYVWIVSTTPNGEVSVAVQGETGFPKLLGAVSGDTLQLEGKASTWTTVGWETQAAPCPGLFETAQPGPKVHLWPTSLFSLVVMSPNRIAGTRTYLGPVKSAHSSGDVVYTPCFAVFEIEATRQ